MYALILSGFFAAPAACLGQALVHHPQPPEVAEIVFAGLRRVPPDAVRAQLSSRPDAPFEPRNVEKDLHALARLGWFASIRVEQEPAEARIRLKFLFEENPFLEKVEFAGSRRLSSAQIEDILAKQGLTLCIARPADPAVLNRVACVIQRALAERGHPQARVTIEREETLSSSVRIRYLISDGPRVSKKAHCVQARKVAPEKPPQQPLYIVRRIEFRGAHRFSDRYYRRRLRVEEGQPLDQRALAAGLTRLNHTGYLRRIKNEDIQIITNDDQRTADILIQLDELGQQRVSFSGGHSGLGNTLGFAYTIFDLLSRDELLTAEFDGGPESLHLILGLAKDGFLSSRGTLALSVFNDFIRPRLGGSVKGPFYTTQSSGFDAGWAYAAGDFDSLGLNFNLTKSQTDYSPALPAGLTGLTATSTHADTSSHSLGAGWKHDSGAENASLASSVSGGWFGGGENLLRSSASYARIFPDPIFRRRDAWAFRGSLFGVGSYRGDMPLATRLFAGDSLVRGFRPGELGPYASVDSIDSSGKETHAAAPAGANIFSAGNVEYRVRIVKGVEAAGFFDMGSGWLLPNWLGSARPDLISTTNGLLRGSTGIELRYTIPGIQVPVRTYYAVNFLRLNRSYLVPGSASLLVRNRRSAFGWALGALF